MTATCNAPAPKNIGRCVLTAGHTGQHWNAGGAWGAAARKRVGSAPMAGTINDVRELRRNVREVAVKLAREGVRLP